MDIWIQTTSNIYNSNRRAYSTSNAADITTTVNIPDNRMYISLISSSSSFSVFSLPFVLYMISDPGYDAKKL
jgi:hypothetical protein